jgi:hypothetical protein
LVAHVKIFERALAPELCAKVIARFDADRRVKADPQPDYSTRRYLNISHCPDWLPLNTELCRAVNDLVAEYFRRPPELAHGTYHEWTDDGYVVACYKPGDTCIMHIDGQCAVPPQNALRIATLLFYLNDVETGGETRFPLQDLKIKPATGRAVMFPVGFTHPHDVLPATSVRYILQTWITDPNLVVLPRDDGLE